MNTVARSIGTQPLTSVAWQRCCSMKSITRVTRVLLVDGRFSGARLLMP